METFWLAMASMIGFMFALVVLFAIMVRKRPGGNSNVQPAPTPAAPAAGGGASGIMQSAWNALNSKFAVALVVTAGLGTLVWAWTTFGWGEIFSSLPGSTPTKIALLIFGGLAVAKACGAGGKASRFAVIFLAGLGAFYVLMDVLPDATYAAIYGKEAEAVREAQQQQEAAEEIAKLEEEELGKNGSLTKQPKWEGAPKGALPVGVWSAPVTIEPNCRLHLFLDEEEKVFSAEWQDYKGQWHALKPNQHLNQSQALRFMVKEEGVVSYPYKKTCS